MRTLIVLVVFSLSMISSVFAGREGGNGGYSIKCKLLINEFASIDNSSEVVIPFTHARSATALIDLSAHDRNPKFHFLDYVIALKKHNSSINSNMSEEYLLLRDFKYNYILMGKIIFDFFGAGIANYYHRLFQALYGEGNNPESKDILKQHKKFITFKRSQIGEPIVSEPEATNDHSANADEVPEGCDFENGMDQAINRKSITEDDEERVEYSFDVNIVHGFRLEERSWVILHELLWFVFDDAKKIRELNYFLHSKAAKELYREIGGVKDNYIAPACWQEDRIKEKIIRKITQRTNLSEEEILPLFDFPTKIYSPEELNGDEDSQVVRAESFFSPRLPKYDRDFKNLESQIRGLYQDLFFNTDETCGRLEND